MSRSSQARAAHGLSHGVSRPIRHRCRGGRSAIWATRTCGPSTRIWRQYPVRNRVPEPVPPPGERMAMHPRIEPRASSRRSCSRPRTVPIPG